MTSSFHRLFHVYRKGVEIHLEIRYEVKQFEQKIIENRRFEEVKIRNSTKSVEEDTKRTRIVLCATRNCRFEQKIIKNVNKRG